MYVGYLELWIYLRIEHCGSLERIRNHERGCVNECLCSRGAASVFVWNVLQFNKEHTTREPIPFFHDSRMYMI
jgi:hypothetical protein